MTRLLLDTRPLRTIPAFRRYWAGSTLSSVGGALTTFALPLQVYDLTRSTLQVGLISAVQLVPVLTIGLAGGALADRVSRRQLIVVTTIADATVSALLATQAAIGLHQLVVLYVLAVILAALNAVGSPVRRTIIPQLLPADQLRAGMALNRISFQITLLAGPALAGLITAVPSLGLRGCYAIDTVTFAASLYGVMPLPQDLGRAPIQRHTLRAVREGLQFVRSNQQILGALLSDLNATVFALPIALFPAINAERFAGDPRTLGLFTTAIGLGGLVTAAFSGAFNSTRHPGAVMLIAVAIWGMAFTGFALVSGLVVTLAALALAGAADTITVVLRGSIVQSSTPDHLRGRVTAVEYVAGIGGGHLGDLEAGTLGSLTTPTTAALIGGVTTILGTIVLAATLTDFLRPTPDQAF